MGEIVEHVLARRDVDRDVGPLRRRDLGQTPLHQRFAGRDDLHDGRAIVAPDPARIDADQARRLQPREQMAEEALLGGFEGRARRRLGLCVEGPRPGLASAP